MKYVGSKNKLGKDLAPIIQSYITEDTVAYIEPFVGGANMIDKIKHHNKIGYDIHEELIELLKYCRDNYKSLPNTITEDEYNKVRLNKDSFPKWYVGFVGFCATFGAKYFGGFARGFKEDKITPRDIPSESIRNIKKQSPNLHGILFETKPFKDIEISKIKNSVVYCDIPYFGTIEYKNNQFQYDEFYDWCIELSKDNTVLISEYWMPEDRFECIWSKEHKVLIDSNKNSGDDSNIRIEKLFIAI